MLEVIELLKQFNDPRDPKKVSHPLPTILFMSICAIFCGAEGWEDIVLWSETHKDWLEKHVDFSRGIPSYSTIRRIFLIISPACWGTLMRDVVLPALSVDDSDYLSILARKL